LFKDSTEHKISFFILSGIVCFYLINNFIWLRQNTYPGGPDEFAHLCFALRFLNSIFYSGVTFPQCFIYETGHWPPFYHLSSLLVSPILGTSHLALVMINTVYLLILSISIYFIGLKLFDKTTGLLAAGLISMYPAIFRYSRVFGPDFALTAMVCLSICLLLYSDYFRNKKFSLLFGISLGIGMLTKWTFILFLIGPLGYILFRTFLSASVKNKQQRFLNISFSLTLGILIAALWYLPAFSRVIWRTKMFFWLINYQDFSVSHPERALFNKLGGVFSYLRFLNNEQISFLGFISFLGGLFIYSLKCKGKLFLLLWCIIPYFTLSLSSHKEARFLMPLLPAVALITAGGIQKIISKRVKLSLWIAIFLILLVQFFDVSYNQNRKNHTIFFQTPIGTLHLFYSPQTEPQPWFYGPPLKKDWKMGKIADCIAKYYKRAPKFPVNVGIICDDDYVLSIFGAPFIIDYFLSKKVLPYVNIEELSSYSLEHLPFYIAKFINNIDKITFFVYISQNNSWPKFDNINRRFIKLLAKKKRNLAGLFPEPSEKTDKNLRLQEITPENAKTAFKRFLNNKSKFDLIGQMSLPEGYYAYVYAKRIDFIKKGPLALFFHKGAAGIYYKDTLLTKTMTISFKVDGKEYHSEEAIWSVQKQANRLITKGYWPDLPLIQLWEIEITDEGDIFWKVEMEIEKEVKIKRWKVSLRSSGRYKEWVSLDEIKRFRDGRVWRGIVLKDLTNRFIGVGNYKGKEDIPGIIFETSMDATECIPVINYNRGIRDLRFHGVKKEVDAVFLPGRHQLFSAKIMLMDKKEMDGYITKVKEKERFKKEELQPSLTINKGELELFFDHGQGRIYFQGRELTKRFGLYTSLFSNGFWQDSQNAIWEIKKVDDHKIVAHGEWIYLPIAQDWEIELVADNIIVWRIKMQVYEEVNIERQQTNVMLSPEYDNWIVIDSGRKGKFSDEFSKCGRKWKMFYSGNVKTTRIAVNELEKAKEHLFPSILLDCSGMPKNFLMSAKNTDEIFKSRVLCCYKVNRGKKAKLFPGEYEYFTGKIEINTLH